MRAIDADALKEDLTRFYDNEVTARKLIDEQPTIQPELSTNLAEVGMDAISREQAIKAIEEEWDGCCSEYPATQIIYDTTEAIERIPAIQPKRGKWIKISPANIYECSECGKSVMTNDICAYDFCHGCGADMREVTT